MIGVAAVSIAFAAFGPAQTAILTGDTVTWTNDAARQHAVDGVTEPFDSPPLVLGDTFSHQFKTPGAVQYYCRIHPFMRGEVDVYDVLLDTPPAAASAGRAFTLTGRAALAPGSPLAIEADDGTGYKPVASTTVGADGTFSASVTPTETASYRVAGAAGNTIQLTVLNRHVASAAARHGRRIAVDAAVTPAAPGATVVLQLKLKERFGWWPVATGRLDARSHVRFTLRRNRAAVARVVLTLPDGATPLAVSPVMKVRALS
jgi:hypothetical protein